MKGKLTYIIVAVVLVVALAIIGGVYWYNANNYVATVDGAKITKAEYQFFLSFTKSEMEDTYKVFEGKSDEAAIEKARKDFWASKLEGEDAKVVAKNKALDKAKEFKIELIKAKDNKIQLTKQEQENFNSNFDSMVETYSQQYGSKEKFEEEIKKQLGINLDEYRSIYRSNMLVSKLREAEQKKISVTDDEVKKYYDENKDYIDSVTVRHILYKTVDDQGTALSKEKQDEAKKKADEMLVRVNAGEDMKALAQQFTEDTGSKENGGEYTFKMTDSYVQEFKDWAFKAKIGDTGIVQTTYGYHVMKLEKRTTYDDGKDTAKKGVQADKYGKEVLEGWKKDPKYNVIRNQKILDQIKVI